MKRLLSLAALVVAMLWAGLAPAQVELFDGDVVNFTVAPATGNDTVINTEFFVDVPPDARSLTLELTNLGAARDLDLLARTGQNFTTLTNVFDQSDYHSISALGDEQVILQEFSTPSVEGKRWYIALLGFAGDQTDARLRVDISNEPAPVGSFIIDFAESDAIDPDCVSGDWNDATPVTPAGGNSATTRGQARRNAMQRAAELLGQELTSRVPIRIRACWKDIQDDDGNSITNTLAAAGATSVAFNTPGLPSDGTIYPESIIVRLAGADDCQVYGGSDCQGAAINIQFNRNFDIDGSGFYYGFDPRGARGGDPDFVHVVMHEIAHGLGFASILASEDGSISPIFTDGVVRPDAFTSLLLAENNGEATPVLSADSDADRAIAYTSANGLSWAGEEANLSSDNDRNRSMDGRRVLLHAPSQFDQGSSVSHINNTYCALMNPSIRTCNGEAVRRLGLAKPMLNALGWNDGVNQPPHVGLMFDRERDGHGYEFSWAGTSASGEPVYVLTFYTYDANGNPEWHQAIGSIRGGAFEAIRNADGNGFPRFSYDANNSPSETAQVDPFAQAAVSFNLAENQPACNDGFARPGARGRSAFLWEIGGESDAWCVESLINPEQFPAQDFGGLWYDPSDSGWGFSLENFVNGDGSIGVFVALYVYAGDGSPVWFFGQANGLVVGQPFTMDMQQRTAFGRTAANAGVSDEVVGTMTLTLTEPPSAPNAMVGNSLSLDVTYQGSEGGSWVRQNSAITRLSLPRE